MGKNTFYVPEYAMEGGFFGEGVWYRKFSTGGKIVSIYRTAIVSSADSETLFIAVIGATKNGQKRWLDYPFLSRRWFLRKQRVIYQ